MQVVGLIEVRCSRHRFRNLEYLMINIDLSYKYVLKVRVSSPGSPGFSAELGSNF